MEKERSIIKNEISDLQDVLFKKKIVDEAFPYLEDCLGSEEAKKLADRLIETFKNTEGCGDFENRVEVAIHNFTHPLAIQAESRREIVSSILNRIISERLLGSIGNMLNSENNNNQNNISPFKIK